MVMNHRQTRAVRCWVVPEKGVIETSAAKIAARGIRELGVTGPIALTSDNEDAISALRR